MKHLKSFVKNNKKVKTNEVTVENTSDLKKQPTSNNEVKKGHNKKIPFSLRLLLNQVQAQNSIKFLNVASMEFRAPIINARYILTKQKGNR